MKNPFKYEVGMYGGCFDPPHLGHVSVMLRAAAECRELNLVLSYSEKRDSVPYRTRYGWLKQLTAHLGNVKIIPLKDECLTKTEYDTAGHWAEGAAAVKKEIGKKVDVVYCSNEYDRPDSPYRTCYPSSELVFVDRNAIPCSSTAIREDPYANWEYIPACVRPHYVKKVLVVGNESTGKTTLVQSLAHMFNTNCVLEYGRYVCEKRGGEDGMSEGDFIDILNGQRSRVDVSVEAANKVLFVDTDAITTSYYAAMNKSVPRDSILFDRNVLTAFSGKWDLVLFMESDVPYVHDGIRIDGRNGKAERAAKTNELRRMYSGMGFSVIDVSGSYAERLAKCAAEVKAELKKATNT